MGGKPSLAFLHHGISNGMQIDWNDEHTLVTVILIFAVFTTVVLSSYIGGVFLAYGLLYYFSIGSKNVYQFSIKKPEWKKALFYGGAVLLLFLMVSASYNSILTGQFNLYSSVQTMSSPSYMPLTLENPAIRFIVYGISISLLETLFILGFVGKFLANKLKVFKFNIHDMNMWVCVVMIGAFSVLLHLASGAISEASLMMDFIFFSVSMLAVIYFNEMKQAGVAHVWINSMQVLRTLGVAFI
jgi:hypothetical protein